MRKLLGILVFLFPIIAFGQPIPGTGSGSGSTTQYTDGDVDSSVTGTAVMFKDSGNEVNSVSGTTPLPVEVKSGLVDLDSTTLNSTFLVRIQSDDSGGATEGTLSNIKTSVQLIDDTIIADDAAFTPATTKVNMCGFEFDDVAPDSVNEGDAGAARMSANRNIYTTLRDAAGNERGVNVTASNQLEVSVTAALPAGTNAIGKLAANSGVDIGDVDVTSVIAGTGATNIGKAEDAGHSSGDTGVAAWGWRNDTISAPTNADADYSPISVDKYGRPIVVEDAGPEARAVGSATTTGTGDTSVVAASGNGSLRTYVKACQVANTGSATSLITWKDGNAGSTLGYTIAPTGGGSNIVFPMPLRTTANTAFYFAAGSASTTIYVTCQGYYAP